MRQITKDNSEMTAEQVRAARAILRWSGRRLAAEAGLVSNTVHRIEDGRSVMGNTIEAIRSALTAQGITFMDTEFGPAVAYRKPD